MPKPDALAERLRVVLRDRSQAEVARRTGNTGASVNRWLAGTRMPADFLEALVREFGVNPVWLLTGKGATYTADIAVTGEQLAGNLLELVEAMGTVAKLRLGAVSGKAGGRVLRELADASNRYEQLRENLHKHSKPVLERVLADLQAKMARRDTDQAQGLIKTAEEVARFCEDTAMRVSLDSFKAEYAYLTGRREDALAMQEEVVMRMLLSHGVRDEGTYLQVFNLASALLDRRRLHDARRVTGAALALAEDAEPRWRALPLLRCMLGLLCLELGELDRAIGLLHRGLAQLPDVDPPVHADTIHFQRSHLERAQLLSGALSLPELLARRDYHPWSFYSATLQALWLEDPAHLETLRPQLVPRDDISDPTARMVYGAALRLGRGKGAWRDFERLCRQAITADPAPFQHFAALALQAQLALAARTRGEALELARQAQQQLEALGPRITPALEVRAIHHRTLLRLGEPGGDFMQSHMRAGYLWLRKPQ
ncbi:MAG: helix-turn-helix transcriptional regulator [Planctomycetes bacterium]|nr:helix-turn-helix transcriptional regulator [Planctomycetota bacterium]MCW8135398.1 helix-turn-helix transcriptional regulator [Planctomycetota bacterium]